MRLLVGVVGVVVLAGCAVTSSGGTAGSSGPSAGVLRLEAGDGCHAKVKELLKSPDTAKWDSTHITRSSSGAYTIDGLVSSENSYGGLIQTVYSCKVRYTGSGGGQDHFVIRPQVA